MSKRELWKKLAVWVSLCLLFVLTRGLIAAPWLWLRVPRNSSLTLVLRCVCSFAAWLLAAMPEHGYHCWRVMRLNGDETGKYSYFRALKVGLYRVLRVSEAAVPAAGLVVLLYYIMNSSFGVLRILKDIGSNFGAQRRYGYDVGLGVILAALVISLIALAILWYRGTPNDYLRTVRPFRKARFDRLTLKNFCLAAVAYLLWGAIAYAFFSARMEQVNGLLSRVTKLPRVIRDVLRQREFLTYMGLVLALVYCPLWCVRKRGAAKAAAQMVKDAA